MKNYWTVAVTDTIGKIFRGLLCGRLSECCKKNRVMGMGQNGFQKDRRGRGDMFVLNAVIERMKKTGRKTNFAFLNVEKAYNRVNMGLPGKLLARIGMSKRIINSIYENTSTTYTQSLGYRQNGQVAVDG